MPEMVAIVEQERVKDGGNGKLQGAVENVFAALKQVM